MANEVKDKLSRGEISYGAWLDWAAEPGFVELLGWVGFEYVMLDAEHGPIYPTNAGGLIRAAEVAGAIPIVRVPHNDPATLLAYLELGAKGIYVPHVNTREDAERIVSAVKYAPEGRRGAGSQRAVQYALFDPPDEYIKRANAETMTIALIEETEGIENLSGILDVPGLDVVGIGDGDLSHSMGYPGKRSDPEVRRVVDDAEGRIAASEKALDAVVSDAQEAKGAVERGCTMISLSVRRFVGTNLRAFLADTTAAGTL